MQQTKDVDKEKSSDYSYISLACVFTYSGGSEICFGKV